MSLNDHFPAFANFIGAWFPDADFEEITDGQVVLEFKKTVSAKELAEVQADAEALSSVLLDYWQDVSREANRSFASLQEATEWLEMVRRILASPIR